LSSGLANPLNSCTQTLRLLYRVDREIVAAYCARTLKALPPDLNAKGKNEYVTRLLEIVDVACGEDGEAYASQLKDLLLVADDASLVLDSIVEVVLLRIRHSRHSVPTTILDLSY
jgi:AP-4 complex subunit epsilon-1